MSRPRFRRTPKLELLESREVLSGGGPSAQAQYMLELVNLTRTNPAAAAQRFTTNLNDETSATLNFYNVNLDQVRQEIASTPAKPPLAWNSVLAQTATQQSQDQANMGEQTHIGADGATLSTRLDRAGYTNRTSAAENAFAYASSVDEAMQAFLIDWGVPSKGHFNNLLQPTTSADQSYHDTGIGIVSTNNKGLGPQVITQDFGRQNGEQADLLGVVYNDSNNDNFYQPGEGIGNATIQAQNMQTGQTASVSSWDAGGYQIPLDPGKYQVTAKVNGQVVGAQQVNIGGDNVEVDFNTKQPFTAPVVIPQVRTQAAVVPAAVTPPPPPPPAAPAPPQVQVQAPPVQAPVQTPPSVQAPSPPQAQPQAQTIMTFSAPVVAPIAQLSNPATPAFNVSWITSWTSWNATTAQNS